MRSIDGTHMRTARIAVPERELQKMKMFDPTRCNDCSGC